ncbi:4738_t:CDS:2 [Funneliformis mosseae]|uniref:4738_t:CDS:1 n=1 Tax=Funneliformis mosseae TaxID=27381 RepID=A0A9N9FLX7_FUNMO|nr:4738_t:CDS:2 [Funneliformis mosseae]
MKRLKSFIIAGIVCLVAVLFIIPVESYTTFVHEESISYPSPPRVWSSIVYEDGTAVFRIIRRDTSVKLPDRTCLIQKLMLRILYPNGTLTELDMELNIPPLNYCIVAAKPDNFDPINISALKPGYLLLRYYNATDPSKPETWEEWGMIIDWQGQTYEPKFLGLSFIDANTRTVVPGLSAVTVNINRAKGFLRLAALRETNDCEWQQYSIGENKELIQLSGGVIKLPIFKSAQFATIATVDEGYAIVFANSSDTVNNADPLLPRGGLFALSLAYGQKSINSPSLLYQVPLANLLFTALKCDIAFVGVGHVCTLTVQQNLGDATNPTKSDLYYLKITFLSSGSVTSFTSISRALPTNINVKVTEWVVSSLPYGGYVLVSHLKTQPTGLVMYAYVFDEDETNGIPWKLDEPSVTNVAGTYKILPNNTLYFAQQEVKDTWSLIFTDLPRFIGDKDHGYSNVHIDTTEPPIQSTISSSLKQISITYYDAVDLSDGKVSIYQINDGGQEVLKQFVSGTNPKYCQISEDGHVVTINIIESTFSHGGSTFYVTMDNNFVKSNAFKEPLIGLRDKIWTFSTEPSEVRFAGSTSGVLRLTVDGTTYFDQLSAEGQAQFFNNLVNEISTMLTIPPSRLKSSGRFQADITISPEKQYLISLDIIQTKDKSEKSVESIIKDLDTMILNKEVSPISLGKTTRYLDATYGLRTTQNLWNKYKTKIVMVFIALGTLIMLFLLAQRREKKGQNMAILQLGLIIFDLLMDILFVSNNARDVDWLYIPSVIFLTVPIGLNTVLAFLIITNENTNQEFFKWFSQHGKVASIFTLLAGADIEALTILQSNMAGFSFFRAPFSNEAKSKIFWGACLSVFLEDIPQVFIQRNTVNYDIIPLLTLISSSLNLTINIIGRLYQAINRLRNKEELELKGKDEGFGGLDPFPKPSVGKINDDEHKIDIKDDQLDVKAAKNLEKKNSKSSFQEMIN